MNKALRAQLFWRANGNCEKCNKGLEESWAAHHRKLRSQGGKDEITNLVALCHYCHNLGTVSVHLSVAKAIADGFIVPSWADPATTLICTSDGNKLCLNLDGTKTTQGEQKWLENQP